MQTLKEFLKPDWKKALLFGVFVLIAIGGHIQSWAFSDVPPKPPLYDFLWPFPLWAMWMQLLFPLILLLLPIRIIGLDVMAAPFWLFVAINGFYFYFLSCLLVVSFNRFRVRFPKWLWAGIIIFRPVLSLLGLFISPLQCFFYAPLPSSLEAAMSFLGSSLTFSFYLYLVSCLGFFVSDIVRKRNLKTV